MVKWYDIQAKGETTAEITIFGDIGESWTGETVTAKGFVEELKALGHKEKIIVDINSYGGSVADGLAIYNTLRGNKAKIITRIIGVAASISSLFAMAGDEVQIAENALLMIHPPWSGGAGNAAEKRKEAEVLDTYAKAMATSYVAKTGIAYEEILALLTGEEDHWYTAQEAVDAGFADSIIESFPVAACLDPTRYKSIPAAAGMFIQPKPEITMAKVKKEVLAADTESDSEDEIIEESEELETEDEAEVIEEIVDEPIEPAAKAVKDVKAKVLAAEKTRRETIRARLGKFSHIEGVNALLDKCLDNHSISPQAASEKLMDILGAGLEPTGGVTKVPKIDVVKDEKDKYIQGASQSLLARCGLEKHDRSNPYNSTSLFEFAKSSLESSGVDLIGKDRFSIAQMALKPRASGFGHGTTDFTVLLENIMHKTLLQAWATQDDTWSQFCSRGSVQDFRDWSRYRTGSIGDINQVNEHGEYLNKAIPDGAKEKVNVKRFGNIINITPELIINDDMSSLSDLTMKLGRAAKRTVENKVYSVLASNPVMGDGVQLFHASRGNLASAGTVPTVDSFDAARVAMLSQRDIGANEYLDVRPSIWLGSLARGGEVRILNSDQFDPAKGVRERIPNKVTGMLSSIIDTPRITGTEWYLFSDPGVNPVIEVTFLDGQSEPRLAQDDDFRTAGIAYRVELTFGVAAVDYVGAYKNPGA